MCIINIIAESSMTMPGRAVGPLNLEHVQIQCLYVVHVEPFVGCVACFCHLSLFIHQYCNLFCHRLFVTLFFLVVSCEASLCL